jgi:DNA-binding response OmpR family regulator
VTTDISISLLLTEVDPDALQLCHQLILRRFPNLIVHAVNDPDEALTLFKENNHDIVVSDLFLPKNDGIHLAREICAINPDTHVLFLTADHTLNKHFLDPYAKELCLKRIVSKPLDVTELFLSISMAIDSITNRRLSYDTSLDK